MSGGTWDIVKLRFATEAAGIALWSWNVDTDRIAMDDQAYELWGVEQGSSVTFEDLSSRIHPEDMDKVRVSFEAIRQSFGPCETDFRVVLGKDVYWISARSRGNDEGIVGRIMYGVFIDVTVRKRAEEARELITGEMHHRIKNLFAMTSALAGIASRTTTSKEAMTHDLMQRLMALSQAHELIRPDSRAQSRASGLGDLLDVLLKPYLDGEPSQSRVKISVPKIPVGELSATALALVMHELATNSMKYGALSSPTGNLAISGNDMGESVEITWQETCDLPVVSGSRTAGFGSRLVVASVEDQLGGTIDVDWAAYGIVVTLKINKARLCA